MCAFFACALHVWQIKGHRTKYTVFFSVQHVLLGKKKDAIHCVTIISACQTAVNRCRWSATANNALHGTDPPRREDTYKTFFVPRPRVPCRATPRIKARCRAINSRFYPIWVESSIAGRPLRSPCSPCTSAPLPPHTYQENTRRYHKLGLRILAPLDKDQHNMDAHHDGRTWT